MKKLTFIGLFFSALTFAGWSQSKTIYFEKNSYVLTELAQLELDSLIQNMKSTNNRKELKLIGHTDVDASADYNKKLALHRAKAVKVYLESKKIFNRCHVFTKGETQNINANANESEKALNRRVVVELNYSSDNSVYKDFRQKYQEYEISQNKDTVLVAKKGTKIFIKANCFNLNPKAGPLKIKVKEFYNKDSFVASNITASTFDNKILESRGMINITASQKGRPVTLVKGKSIDVLFKDREIGDSTQLFIGKRLNGELVWVQQKENSKSSDIGFSGWSKTTIGGVVTKEVDWYETIDAGVRLQITKTKIGVRVSYDTISLESRNELRSNLMSVSKLGWINCDRFYKNPAEKIEFVVVVPGDLDADVTVVFEDINSVMPYTFREGDNYVFKGIPVGMKIKVIALYKNEKQADYYLAAKNFVVQKENSPTLQLKKGTKEEVKNMIAEL